MIRSVPSPRAAWVLGRLLCGQPLDGELETLAAPWKGVASHLQEVPQHERLRAWDGFLMAFDDWYPIAQAVVNQDPNGPPPPATADDELPLVVRTAAAIPPRLLQWLWQPRLPLGMLALFAGDPKLGKSLVTTALAAAVSRGAALPGDEGRGEPAHVLLLSAEDDPARTIVPRLRAAGADLAKVHLVEAMKLTDGTELLPQLRTNLAQLEQTAAFFQDTRLIVVDPVSAYLGGVDDHRNTELRGVFTPLARTAERLGAAVVLVTHLNKAPGTNALHRVMGSMAYVGACRANFLFLRDRQDPTRQRVLMLDAGCNLAAAVPTLAYRIEDRGAGPVVAWEAEPVAITAEEALAAEASERLDQAEARGCAQWLRATLAEGPVEANEVLQASHLAGFTRDQVKRAKQRLGIPTQRRGFGSGSKWVWSLPGQPEPEAEATANVRAGRVSDGARTRAGSVRDGK